MKYQKDRECLKCGEVGAASIYVEGPVPYMERRCRNCGYYWTEEPLDEEAADEG